jgi:hypothetical protein
VPALNALATKPFDARTTFGDRAHLVHLYVIEPHPQAPDVGPYSGTVSVAQYSSKRQAMTYADREAAARDMAALLTGRQLMLVDDLGGAMTNPIWCTYGTCANCSFLVRQDGVVDTVQLWLDVAAIEQAIRRLVDHGTVPEDEPSR